MTNNKSNLNQNIAIDGGAATGKSTISKILAKNLNLEYINTGEMYRFLTYIAVKNKLLDSPQEIVDQAKKYLIGYKNNKITTKPKIINLNYSLHKPAISDIISQISSYKEIRIYASELQKELAKNSWVVMEGRDIGTTIIPNAKYKFFLIVDSMNAAKRRHDEYVKKGIEVSFRKVRENIIERNFQDKERKYNPLLKAKNAIEINTSNKTIEEVVVEIQTHIKKD